MIHAIKNLRLRRFNMVEITIALLILGIGLISILGVFPIAANSSRQAIGQNYAAGAGEELLNFVSARAKEDWTVVTGIGTARPNIASYDTAANLAIGNFTKHVTTGTGKSGIYGRTGDPSIYRVIVETNVGGGTAPAFDGLVRLWKSEVVGYYYDGSSWQTAASDSGYTRGAQINVEISWPATIPYAGRSRAFYSLEVSKND